MLVEAGDHREYAHLVALCRRPQCVALDEAGAPDYSRILGSDAFGWQTCTMSLQRSLWGGFRCPPQYRWAEPSLTSPLAPLPPHLLTPRPLPPPPSPLTPLSRQVTPRP